MSVMAHVNKIIYPISKRLFHIPNILSDETRNTVHIE